MLVPAKLGPSNPDRAWSTGTSSSSRLFLCRLVLWWWWWADFRSAPPQRSVRQQRDPGSWLLQLLQVGPERSKLLDDQLDSWLMLVLVVLLRCWWVVNVSATINWIVLLSKIFEWWSAPVIRDGFVQFYVGSSWGWAAFVMYVRLIP